MATYVKFEKFCEDLCSGVHQLHAAGHQLKFYLSNAAPNAATHTIKADIAEISTGNGYAGPVDIENDLSRSGATTTIICVDKTVTATGAISQFRYVIVYNDTPTSPADPLIAYWDYGSAVDMTNGETFDIDFTNLFTLA